MSKQNTNSNACQEAELFAMNLMLPQKMVFTWCLKLCKAEVPKNEYHIWIAKLFGVPESKARQRLQELRII